MINLFQQRDFGDKINVTFQYISQNFRSFALSMLYIAGPVALIAGVATGIMQSNVLNITKESTQNVGTQDPMAALRMVQNIFSPSFWIAILFSALSILAVSLTTYAHMKLYARKNGAPITVADVWAEVQPALGRGIIITIIGGIITFVATLFLVIPGLYVGIVLSLALAVTSFEGTDFGATWNRCFVLIRDKWWSTFGLLVVTGIISGIVGLIFTLPAGIVSFLITAKLLPDVSGTLVVLSNVVGAVGGTLLRSIIYVAIGFQYTNLVERQEGRGLLSAINSIGTKPTQPTAQDEGDY